MCAFYLQIKWTDKIALTVFSMTVNLDVTIKILAEDALEGQQTAVTNRRVSQDTSFFLLACQLLTHWILRWRHTNAEHARAWQWAQDGAVPQSSSSECCSTWVHLAWRSFMELLCASSELSYRQHYTEQCLPTGIFSEKKSRNWTSLWDAAKH